MAQPFIKPVQCSAKIKPNCNNSLLLHVLHCVAGTVWVIIIMITGIAVISNPTFSNYNNHNDIVVS